MVDALLGIHHVTAISNDAQATFDFYAKTLGLRFVKKTVNQDDPTSYHLYFGDAKGNPGSALTFFIWDLPRATNGNEEIRSVEFAIPRDSLDYWKNRLKSLDISFEETERFGVFVLTLRDRQGLAIELVPTTALDHAEVWDRIVPAEHAIRGFAGVSITHATPAQTSDFARRTLGFESQRVEGACERLQAGNQFVDIVTNPDAPIARMGSGSIHHVAFRTRDDRHHIEWQNRLRKNHANVTEVIDRFYFKSIYFREPGGTLFEIATDQPGFLADEKFDELGSRLQLPPWFETARKQIEQQLPRFETTLP